MAFRNVTNSLRGAKSDGRRRSCREHRRGRGYDAFDDDVDTTYVDEEQHSKVEGGSEDESKTTETHS